MRKNTYDSSDAFEFDDDVSTLPGARHHKFAMRTHKLSGRPAPNTETMRNLHALAQTSVQEEDEENILLDLPLPCLPARIEAPLPSVVPSASGSNSKLCDACGHAGTHVNCSRCPVSLHKTCIIISPNFPLPKTGWWCSGCMHEAIRVREIEPPPLLRRDHRTLPSNAQNCSSCGCQELESLNCDACCRWFCYGCMCVSQECVPSGEWACPECMGQDAYDEKLSPRIKILRDRWVAGKMTTKERDGYTQLVYDLLCACAWKEWKINVEVLVSDNLARLARDRSYKPTILPFQVEIHTHQYTLLTRFSHTRAHLICTCRLLCL